MNRKIPIGIFRKGLYGEPPQEGLTLRELRIRTDSLSVEEVFNTPIDIDGDQEFVLRINHKGATLEICKIDEARQ